MRVDAATGVIVPDSVTSSTWTGSYTAIDEGTTTTSDYINSGSTSGVSGQFGMSDLGSLSSASSISVNICAYSATNANGGTLDSLTVNVLINGVAQTAQTITPAYSATSTCTLYNPIVLNGSYTQSDINSLQLTLATTVKGSGNPTGQIDDVRVANAYMSINYTPTMQLSQANYRWFANADSVTPGSPLAAQDTAAAVSADTVVRLRQRIAVDSSALSQSANNYKLQYSSKVGTCDAGFSGETYTDVNGPLGDAARQPTTAVNDSSYGTTAWTNPTGGITSGDSSFAEIVSPDVAGSTNSQYLKLSNFGFTIPAGATITGVKATFTIQTNSIAGTAGRSSVQIVKGGIATGTAKGNAGWYSSDTTDTTGNSSDLWGTTLTPADVNASDFGVAIAANAQYDDFGGFATYADIDGVTLDVYYTAPPSPLQYFDNTTPADAATITSSGNDPVNGARPTVYQSYRETNPFTNNVGSIAAGSDGMWDFSLKLSSNATGSYCIRVVKADGSLLNTYNSVAEITVLPSSVAQANYRWFDNKNSVVPDTPLTTQDTAASVAPDTAVRLRQRIAVDGGSLDPGVASLKLQYAEKVGICDPSFTGETYTDVGGNSGSASATGSSAVEDASSSGGSWSSGVSTLNVTDGTYTGIGSSGSDVSTKNADLTGYNFNIPAGAVVTGIGISLPYQVSAFSTGYLPSIYASLIVNGVTTSYSRGVSVGNGSGTTTIGGPSQTFGASLTSTDVNAANFGIALVATAAYDSYTGDDSTVTVDSATVTVYYAMPGPINFGYNVNVNDGDATGAATGDPTNAARSVTYQSYESGNPFTTRLSIPDGGDGLWDFVLKPAAAADGKTYCLRSVYSDGSLLSSYSQIPELTVGSSGPTLDQQMRGGQYVIGGTKGKFTW
jgi:hypothetical protein